MSEFGLTFESLFQLDVDELAECARVIEGEKFYCPYDKDVLIRGVIMPFMRVETRSSKYAAKDDVVRAALVQTAQGIGVKHKEWDQVSTAELTRQVKSQFQRAFLQKLRSLNQEDLQEIIKNADENLAHEAHAQGVDFNASANGQTTEESSSIFFSTAMGFAALSKAISVVAPWATYAGAKTILGTTFGPIGWVLTSAGIAVAADFLPKLFSKRGQKLKIVIIAIIRTLGEDPFEWFGLNEFASNAEVKATYQAMMKTFHPDTLSKNLPGWVKYQFNEWLLKTQESYDLIKKYQEETQWYQQLTLRQSLPESRQVSVTSKS